VVKDVAGRLFLVVVLLMGGSVWGNSPTTAESGGGSLAQLEEKRDGLVKQINIEEAKLARSDPLWAEAVKRDRGLSSPAWHEKFLADAAAEDWLRGHAKDPAVIGGRANSFTLYRLNAAIRVLKEPTDAKLFENAVLNKSTLKRKELADDLAKEFPDLDRKGMDDRSVLWKCIATRLPAAGDQIRGEIAKLPEALGCPVSVVEGSEGGWERYLRSIVYSAYSSNHMPASLMSLYDQHFLVQSRIDALVQADAGGGK
jgi:hypothetical protein